jgi:hypothetical protein
MFCKRPILAFFPLCRNADMALSPQPASTFDIGFFRNTGLALLIATLVAGAITLSLTLMESRSVILAREVQTQEPAETMAGVTGAIQRAYQEVQTGLQ